MNMTAYRLRRTTDPNGKEYIINARNLIELRNSAYGKIPDGRYSVRNEKGVALSPVTVNKRGYLPKEEYDKLYFYIPSRSQRLIESGEYTPVELAGRRYDSLQEVRKSALVKSYKSYKINTMTGYENEPVLYDIYKGNVIVGQVYCSPFAKAPYKGTGKWIEYFHPKGNPIWMSKTYRLLKDGSIEADD